MIVVGFSNRKITIWGVFLYFFPSIEELVVPMVIWLRLQQAAPYHLMFIQFIHVSFKREHHPDMIRSLPHVEFWAPLWLEKDSHETSHWKLEHPFNGLVSNSSRSISPFFGVFIEAGEPVEPFHNRLCWSTMKGWKAELEFHCSIAASSNGLSMMSLCDVCNNDLCGMCAKNDWKDLKGPKCFATLA